MNINWNDIESDVEYKNKILKFIKDDIEQPIYNVSAKYIDPLDSIIEITIQGDKIQVFIYNVHASLIVEKDND